MRPKAKARVFATVLVVLGSIVGLAIAEALARVFYDAPWHVQLIAQQDASARYPVRRNRWRLRDRDYPSTPSPGHLRILVLGDSFTAGMGVRRMEDLFVERAERALNDSPLPEPVRRVDILNGGIPGSLTRQWADLWDRVSGEFQPDIVIFVFFLRDGVVTKLRRDFYLPARATAQRNQASLLYRSSYLFRLFRDGQDRAEASRTYGQRVRRGYLGNARDTWAWQRAQENLRYITERARARGTAVGFVIFPVLADLNDRYPFGEVHEVLTTFARDELRVPVHDLLPAFHGQSAPDLWVSSLDQHPNPEGHRIAAESLLPFVRKLIASWLAEGAGHPAGP